MNFRVLVCRIDTIRFVALQRQELEWKILNTIFLCGWILSAILFREAVPSHKENFRAGFLQEGRETHLWFKTEVIAFSVEFVLKSTSKEIQVRTKLFAHPSARMCPARSPSSCSFKTCDRVSSGHMHKLMGLNRRVACDVYLELRG